MDLLIELGNGFLGIGIGILTGKITDTIVYNFLHESEPNENVHESGKFASHLISQIVINAVLTGGVYFLKPDWFESPLFSMNYIVGHISAQPSLLTNLNTFSDKLLKKDEVHENSKPKFIIHEKRRQPI